MQKVNKEREKNQSSSEITLPTTTIQWTYYYWKWLRKILLHKITFIFDVVWAVSYYRMCASSQRDAITTLFLWIMNGFFFIKNSVFFRVLFCFHIFLLRCLLKVDWRYWSSYMEVNHILLCSCVLFVNAIFEPNWK